MWLAFGVAALLALIGLMVDRFKMYFLISGYNTMSKAKRENVDIARVARLMALWAYANAVMFTLCAVLIALDVYVPWGVVAVFFVISTVYMLVWAQRYDGNIFDDSGHVRPGAWKQLAVVGAVLVALVVGLVVLVALMGQSENASAGQSSARQNSAGQHRAQGLGHGLNPGLRGMVEP